MEVFEYSNIQYKDSKIFLLYTIYLFICCTVKMGELTYCFSLSLFKEELKDIGDTREYIKSNICTVGLRSG